MPAKARSVQLDSTLVLTSDNALRPLGKRILSGRLSLKPMSRPTLKTWTERLQGRPLKAGSSDAVRGFDELAPDGLQEQARTWLASAGIADETILGADRSMLVCNGSMFHTDTDFFADSAFAVIWLSKDAGWDFLVPALKVRIPLEYGAIFLFDPSLPHGVVRRGMDAFEAEHFGNEAAVGGRYACIDDLDINGASVGAAIGVAPVETWPSTPAGCTLIGWSSESDHKVNEVAVDDRTGAWKILDALNVQ